MNTAARLIVLTMVLSGIPLSQAMAQARTFEIERGARATFVSDAPLETINGVASTVTGEFTADPADLGSCRGTIEVAVASIRTGIDLRDEHLRSDSWLDASRYPTAKFELTSVRGASSLTAGRTASLTFLGRFTIHGRTRDVTATGDVQLMSPEGTSTSSDVIRVRARFRINLTEYGISVPAIVRLKVSDEIVISVSFRARAR